jgi:integrase
VTLKEQKQMAGKKKQEVTLTLEWGAGNVVKKKGSDRLYYDFTYMGERVEISTGMPDTPKNREKAIEWLIKQRRKMAEGEFQFCEAFPNASPAKRALFAAKEGTVITAKSHHVHFGDHIPIWYKEVWEPSGSVLYKREVKAAVEYWIVPFFKDKTFFEINSSIIGDFIRSLKHKDGKYKGRPLSEGRISDILTPLRSIWNDACERYRWELPDPFKRVKMQMPEKEEIDECVDDDGNIPQRGIDPRLPLRFKQFMTYLDKIDPWYRPVAELWMLTGLIPSEMAGLTVFHIRDGYLYIRRSICRGVEKKRVKTQYRRREIKITAAIQRVLDVFLGRAGDSNRLITLKSGKPLNCTKFRKVWVAAEKAAGLPHRVPYVLRHSFAAWALAIGIDPNRLVSLMGHATKQMIYEVYGNYVEGLEEDRAAILAYMGPDFVAAESMGPAIAKMNAKVEQ